MNPVKILYAEDDETLAYLTVDNLQQQHYAVTHCADGESCLKAFKKGSFDICIFDILLPKMDGFELTTEIRKIDAEIPIFFLSSKILKEDRIKGLRLGADDYLVKPFSMEELLLKIEIFLKRPVKLAEKETAVYEVGRYLFNATQFRLYTSTENIQLTQREASLLKLFLEHRNKVLKREQILTALWGDDDYFMGRSLDVFISRLRKLLASEKQIRIENLHGIGFRFSED